MLKCSQGLNKIPIGAAKLWSFKSVNLIYLSSIRNRPCLWPLPGEMCLRKFPHYAKISSIWLKILKLWLKLKLAYLLAQSFFFPENRCKSKAESDKKNSFFINIETHSMILFSVLFLSFTVHISAIFLIHTYEQAMAEAHHYNGKLPQLCNPIYILNVLVM